MAYQPVASLANAHDDGIWSAAWSSSGQLVTGSCDESVRSFMVHGAGVENKHEFSGHVLGVTSVSVTPDGTMAASSSLDASIRLWDLETGGDVRTIEAGPIEAWTVAFAGNNNFIASGSQDGHVNLWSVANGECVARMPTGNGKFAMSVAASATHIACGGADGSVHIFDLNTQRMLARLDNHSATVRSLAFSADGSLLVSGSDDAHATLYEVRALAPVASLEGHSSWVLGSAFSPDGSSLVTSGADRTVRLWDVASRQCVQTLEGNHTDQVWAVTFDPSSGAKRFASVGDDKTVHVYERLAG